MIFDTHAHYDDEAFDEDREALLSGLTKRGIGTVVNVGADMESTKTTIELTKRYPFIYGAAGVHPGHVGPHQHLPVGVRAGADADGGDAQLGGDAFGRLGRDHLQHHRERPGLLQ